MIKIIGYHDKLNKNSTKYKIFSSFIKGLFREGFQVEERCICDGDLIEKEDVDLCVVWCRSEIIQRATSIQGVPFYLYMIQYLDQIYLVEVWLIIIL